MKLKRIFALILAVLFVVPMCFAVLSGCTSYDETLVIYNWEDYIDLDLLDEFTEHYKEETGKTLKIIYSTFDTNETMLANITKGDAKVDLICPSEYAIQKLKDQDLLKPFPKSEMSRLDDINPMFKEQMDDVFADYTSEDGTDSLFEYVVPYMWGTLGILYNTTVISAEQAEEAGWGLLWNSTNIPGIDGTIFMKDSIRDVYVATLLYAKEKGDLPEKYHDLSPSDLINTVDDELLALCEKLLIEQRPHLKGYEVDIGKDEMAAGRAYVDLVWSGDAMYAIYAAEEGLLDYFVPGDTGNIWFDGWVMPKTVANERAATMFVDFLCSPQNAVRNMMYIGYSSAVDKTAFEALTEDEKQEIEDFLGNEDNGYGYIDDDLTVVSAWDDFFGNTIQYPEELDNLGVMRDFQGKNASVVAMWERVKSETDNDYTLIICLLIIIGVALGIVASVLLYKVYDKKFPKRRYLSQNGSDVQLADKVEK